MKIIEKEIPPRIVLSRKGSDSKYGGKSSVRIGDRLISLAIPEYLSDAPRRWADHVTYQDLQRDCELGNMAGHLSSSLGLDAEVHLDPDIRPELRRLGDNCKWLLFGQEKAAQGHLRKQSIGEGSLFLFFGWFQEAIPALDKLKRIGPDQHVIWGWFQVRDSFPVTSNTEAKTVEWAKHHPHVSHWQRYGSQNRLYRATDRLSFAPELPGAGTFRWHPDLTLTQLCCTGATRTHWCVPAFLMTTGLSYNKVGDVHCPHSTERIHFKSADIGQEFVFPKGRALRVEERAEVATWLSSIFDGARA